MLRKFVNCYAMVLVIGSLLVFFTGCGSSADKENTGAIKLNISAKSGTKTILPDIDMTPAKYNVTGTGPDSAVFDLSITDASVEIPELAFGEWAVNVDALNADDMLIARGNGNFTVHTGETTPAEIIVTPLDGNGTLDITIQWNSEDTEVPSIEAQLINADEEVFDLPFTINGEGNTATFSYNEIPAGYYILNVKLLDNIIYTMGAVEIVRVVDGETTTGTFEFNEINKPGGSFLIDIIADMEEPIVVTMSEIPEEIKKGTTMSVTASVPDGLEYIKYIWFINGEQKHIGSTADPSYDIPVDSLKTGGVYRIDIVALTMDGKRGGSATDKFRIIAACPESVFEGDYSIMTQADIDNLSGYTRITGSLVIGDLQAILNGETPEETTFTNLTGLECLTHIEGALLIISNNALTSLNGLNNLKTVDGTEVEQGGDIYDTGLVISRNSSLTNLDGLNQLTSVGGLMGIEKNAALTNLEGLNNLKSVGGFVQIQENTELTNLDGFQNLTSVNGMIGIVDNSALTSINGFNKLTTIDGYIEIRGNSVLKSIDSFNNLTSIGGAIYDGVKVACIIQLNPSMESIEGLNKVTYVDGLIGVSNDAMTSLNIFNMLISTDSGIIVTGNDALTNFNSFSNTTSIGTGLSIEKNIALTNLNCFNNLTFIGGSIIIRDNSVLVGIEGFNNLTNVVGNFTLWNNIINTLDAFNSLTTVGGMFHVSVNDGLTNLDNFGSLCSVTNGFRVMGNSELCSNLVETLRNIVEGCSGGGIGGTISISDNKICQ